MSLEQVFPSLSHWTPTYFFMLISLIPAKYS